MWLIVILILAGVLLLVAELVLLPGLSVAGICSLLSYGGAVYIAFERFGSRGGLIVIAVCVVLSVAAAIASMRARTWRRLALNDNIDGVSQPEPSDTLKTGDEGITVTRLAPSGKIIVNGETYEARTLNNAYVDPGTTVEIVDFENFTVIVLPADRKKEPTAPGTNG